MRRLESALRGAVIDLQELGWPFALIGGFAISARCEPRTTRDVDLGVSVASDEEAEQLVSQLLGRGYRLKSTVEHTASGRLATARTLAPARAVVDLLFASCGFEQELVAAAETIEIFDGFRVPVASIAHLIAMKILSRNDETRPHVPELEALLG